MLRPQETRFWQAVLQSGLTTAERLAACWAQIPPEKRTPEAIDRRLARRVVEAGLLSRWQAQQLLAGVKPQLLWYDRYALVDLLGQGGMGRVFLARDSRLDRPVALKVLSREGMSSPRALARFRREARVGAQFQHENLVGIYDEGEAAGHAFLVMEYIDGKTAGQLVARRGPLPADIAARIAQQVALALEHASQKGLLHRDVNPQNILIARDGTVKLADMGLAIDLSNREPVTRDGATVGTFDYISPEQARSSPQLDIRSDLYSLGCSLYHLLAGRVPFPHPSLAEKFYAHQVLAPTPLREVVTGVPLDLERVVQRLMAKAPADRYATASETAAALKPFQGPPMSLEAIESAPEVPVWIEAESTDDGALLSEAATRDPKAAAPAPVPPARPADPAPVPKSIGSDIFGIITRINTGPITPPSETSSPNGRRSTAEHLPARHLPVGSILLAVLACLVLTALGVLYVYFFAPGNIPGGPRTASGGPRSPQPSPPPKEVEPAPLRNPVTVLWPGAGNETEEMSLTVALKMVARENGEILVRKPLEFGDATISIPKGRAIIRAADGAHPVAKARWGGDQPAIRVRLDGALKPVGPTFDPEKGAKGATLIGAAGDMTLDRDTLVAAGEVHDGKVLARGRHPRDDLQLRVPRHRSAPAPRLPHHHGGPGGTVPLRAAGARQRSDGMGRRRVQSQGGFPAPRAQG